ncbi:DedA family protein [Nocardioides pocheonensis]|uniref:DedA family protein n=1 Tax=Nocardioides pocheonensis TaxID=661485 RepID=A0A3N0GYG0_9ACTN|nr:DedA family protein [Nocardioides pocheonensis]RNM17513.1 DedA family protein [Nocardioides pocheonensis]
MSSLLDGILGLDPLLILAVTGLLVFAEDAIFIGFVIPGETAAVLAGVGAGLGHIALPLSLVVVVVAAIAGDSVGYEVGRRFFGPRVLTLPLLERHAKRIERARAFLRRRGGIAVFLGRFTAFFRAMMPALAGASHMPYRTFLLWNAFGGVVWGSVFVVVGYIAGASYHQVEKQVGRGIAVGLVVVVVAAVVVWRVRSERRVRER